MPDLAAVLLGNGEVQEADMDCRRLSGNYLEEGIKENTAQQVQPREKAAALATDIEMGSTAEIQAGGTPCEIHSPKAAAKPLPHH